MQRWIKHIFQSVLIVVVVQLMPVFANDTNRVDFMHWWVSKGEQASINVLKIRLHQQGIVWQDHAQAGSGTAR